MFSIQTVVQTIILLIVCGLIWWLLWWLVNFINPPEPFRKVATVVLAIAAVLVVISILLSLAGVQVIRM